MHRNVLGRAIAAFVLLSLAVPAAADDWLPYTDGRTGGCFINRVGYVYGCTPQPKREPDRDRERARAAAAKEQLATPQIMSSGSSRTTRTSLPTVQPFRPIDGRARGREYTEQIHSSDSCGASYAAELKRQGLKRHPSIQGLCISTTSEPGSGAMSAQACPPC